MRRRATRVTPKCSYSEHKWAAIKEPLGVYAPCTVRAVSPLRVLRFTPCGLSGAYESLCYFMGVSLSRDALEKGLRRLGSCRTFARGGRSPPLPLRERCHGAAAEVLFFGGKFGIKQGMRGELVIKIGLGVSVRVDGKPRLKCVDCLFPPPPHTQFNKSVRARDVWCCRELSEREDFNEPSAPVVSSERRLSPRMIWVNSMRNVSRGLRVKVARFLAPESGGKEACWSGRRSVCPHRRRRVGERVAARFT